MKKVKTFLHVVKNSFLPSHSYYKKILKTPFFFSFQYFIGVIFLINTVIIGIYAIKINPFFLTNVFQHIRISLDRYPKEMVLTIKKGVLSSSYERPYFFWLDVQKNKQLLVVIDERATPQYINKYNATILINAKELVSKESSKKDYSIYPLNNVRDQIITKDTISQIQSVFDKIISIIPLVYIVCLLFFLILIPFVSFISTSIFLFLSAIILYIVYKYIFKRKYHFKKIVQISFHAITITLMIDYLLLMFQKNISVLPFTFLTLVILFSGVGIYEAHYEKTYFQKNRK